MQKVIVQTNDVPKTVVRMLILTKDDFTMQIKNGMIDEPSFEMLSRYDFVIAPDEVNAFAYIMYIHPTGRIKYIKAKHHIQQ